MGPKYIRIINTKRDFYSDVYAFLNRNELTIWIIYAFRVLNPCQWSLAKKVVKKRLKIDALKVPKYKLKPKGMV